MTTGVVCEGSGAATLACAADEQIQVEEVFYGRDAAEVCPHAS